MRQSDTIMSRFNKTIRPRNQDVSDNKRETFQLHITTILIYYASWRFKQKPSVIVIYRFVLI